MLRPASPLTILLLAAFILLLLSVISTPIVRSIPLASFDGVDFGVFGYCRGSDCSGFEVGYNTAPLFTADEAATFDLPSSTRATLSAILIVHPIAAFFTLVMLICAASAHMHSPSHSTRYLCVVFILSIVTLLLSLLAFLIDVLLFVPHMAWGSYLVLVAVILIAISGVVLCAMRRTLVGRKARKKRIEGNAEMSGENYYARNGPAAASVPMTGTMIEEKPSFTTVSNTETNEESRPLTEQSPADMSPVAMSGANGEPSGHSVAGFATMPPRVPSNPRDRDQSAPPALGRPMYDAGMGMGARGRGGSRGRGWGGYGPPPPGPYRGGFGMRGRGNYGPPPGRGGFGPPPRGQYGPMCAGSDGRGGFGPPAGYMGPPRINNGMMAATGPGREGSAPPTYRKPLPLAAPPNEGPVYDAFGQVIPAYQRQRSPATGYVAYQAPPDEARSTMPTAESPPPLPAELEPARITPQTAMIGQAVEMDAATGSPSHPPQEYRPYQPGSDRDPHGFVEDSEQQHRGASYGSSGNNPSGGEDVYVPPRQGWTPGGLSQPLRPAGHDATGPSRPRDNYYEDVDQRFASSSAEQLAQYPPRDPSYAPNPPAAAAPPPSRGAGPRLDPRAGGMGYDGAYDAHTQSGARSPAAESDGTDFTSVSQRGINPRWPGDPMPTRRVNQQVAARKNDLLLNSNPDFSLPTGRGGHGLGGSSRGLVADGPYGTG